MMGPSGTQRTAPDKTRHGRVSVSVACLSALFGLGIGIAIGKWGLPTPRASGSSVRESGYQFISPLLECEVSHGLESVELHPFEYQVQQLITQKLMTRQVEHLSVYFRELNDGPWFGINENDPFTPASLLKVPLLIAGLKQAESHPALLQQQLTFTISRKLSRENLPSPHHLEPDHAYTVDELLYWMVAYSDNDAKDLILGVLDPEVLSRTFKGLGIEVPDIRRKEDYMSVKTYASFFRILYNASYLTREMSEKALSYLSKSAFTQGLRAGVPAHIPVAHKFGERGYPKSTLKQFHDCGIVYYPSRPYLLCIMTRAESFASSMAAIQEVSELVYQEVSASAAP